MDKSEYEAELKKLYNVAMEKGDVSQAFTILIQMSADCMPGAFVVEAE